MTRLLSLAAAGLILAGVSATPAAADHWRGGGHGHGYHGQHRWGGWDRPRWGGHHWGGPYAGYRHWGGPRCRTVVVTRWSNWRGHYVQRPVEMCG